MYSQAKHIQQGRNRDEKHPQEENALQGVRALQKAATGACSVWGGEKSQGTLTRSYAYREKGDICLPYIQCIA